MITNKYTAEVPFKLGDKEMVLEYDWKAVSKLYSAFGPQALTGLTRRPPDEVALFIQVGLEKHQPEITVDDVTDARVPFLSVFEPIERAIFFFYYGPEGPPAKAEAEDVPDEKKS